MIACFKLLGVTYDKEEFRQEFSSNYLKYDNDPQENTANLDIIEFLRPPKDCGNFCKEVEKRNKIHWSIQLPMVSESHIQTMKHKLEAW